MPKSVNNKAESDITCDRDSKKDFHNVQPEIANRWEDPMNTCKKQTSRICKFLRIIWTIVNVSTQASKSNSPSDRSRETGGCEEATFRLGAYTNVGSNRKRTKSEVTRPDFPPLFQKWKRKEWAFIEMQTKCNAPKKIVNFPHRLWNDINNCVCSMGSYKNWVPWCLQENKSNLWQRWRIAKWFVRICDQRIAPNLQILLKTRVDAIWRWFEWSTGTTKTNTMPSGTKKAKCCDKKFQSRSLANNLTKFVGFSLFDVSIHHWPNNPTTINNQQHKWRREWKKEKHLDNKLSPGSSSNKLLVIFADPRLPIACRCALQVYVSIDVSVYIQKFISWLAW